MPSVTAMRRAGLNFCRKVDGARIAMAVGGKHAYADTCMRGRAAGR
jgi:hypothetical protein